MAKAIFRVQGISTTGNLNGSGKHNIDRVSFTNKDIDPSRSHENITLKKCEGNYNEMFNHITKDLRKQHEQQMETTRKSRQKSFTDKINNDKADVACEFLMSASPEYFEGKSREEIEKWGRASLEFVTKEIGIEEKNILHAAIHMDEKTPHMHLVAVPLVEKYDGRRKKDVLAISRKHFIKTREDMAKVQTRYVDHMNEQGFSLERGLEQSGTKHLDVVRYKVQETEKELLEKKSELEEVSKGIEQTLQSVPDEKEEIPFLKKETETVKTGFMQKEEKETGNYILTSDQYEEMNQKLDAAVTLKKDYDRLKNLDSTKTMQALADHNRELKAYIGKNVTLMGEVKEQMADLKKENQALAKENGSLKSQISDLKREVRLVYQSTREFLKERTEGVKAFRGVLKGFVDKVKDKVAKSDEKLEKEPKMGEFEMNHKRELHRERNQGMER